MSRTAREALNLIPQAIARGDEFHERLRDAEGDILRLSDLMAEAIAMAREARGLEYARRDGRTIFCMEELQAAFCLDDARAAYARARGSNGP